MKKILLILSIMLLIFGTVGCGASSNDTADNGMKVESGSSEETATERVEVVAETSEADSSEVVATTEDTTSDASYEKSSSDTSIEVRTDNQQVSQAGQLTAGRWNDNDNFDYFMDVLNDNEWYSMQSHWRFQNWRRYEFKVINKQDEPLIGANITLYDEQGNFEYAGVTNNEGRVIIYPFLDKTFVQAPQLNGRVEFNQNTYEIVDMNDSFYKITLDEEANKVKHVDIMFMVDTTGSMSDELNYLKTELTDVIKRVNRDNQNNLDIRMSGNYYRDHGDQYLVRPFEFTDNIGTVVDQMNQQSADGGGDYEEAVVEALSNGIRDHEWRSDAEAKLLFLVLDAPPHHNDQNITSIHHLIKEASEMGIRIIPVASSGVDKETEFLLRFMDVATNGTYVFLTDHSGIGNSHITPTIGYYQVEQLNNMLVDVINDYVK